MQTYPSEKTSYSDPKTGREVIQLTKGPSNNGHPYFTNNCFTEDSNGIVFLSDRTGSYNVFRMDLDSGKIRQLSSSTGSHGRTARYYRGEGDGSGIIRPTVALGWKTKKVYFVEDEKVKKIDLNTGEEITIYSLPNHFAPNVSHLSGGGDLLLLPCSHIDAYRAPMDERRQYQVWKYVNEKGINSYLLIIKTDGSSADIVWEENCWITHAQICPADDNLILYCHEGPWNDVRQRMWIVNYKEKRSFPLREQDTPDLAIGHEEWLKSGDKVLYHGWWHGSRSEVALVGIIDRDGKNRREFRIPNAPHYMHCSSSPDGSRIVMDGGPNGGMVSIGEIKGDKIDINPICQHNTSWKNQDTHPHPIFSHDGRKVLFTSDRDGSCDVYLVENV